VEGEVVAVVVKVLESIHSRATGFVGDTQFKNAERCAGVFGRRRRAPSSLQNASKARAVADIDLRCFACSEWSGYLCALGH
jgi:hypothetical protein